MYSDGLLEFTYFDSGFDTQPAVSAATLNNLERLYFHMEDYEKALPLYRRALDIYEKALGSQHPDIAATLSSLVELYRQMGAYEEV